MLGDFCDLYNSALENRKMSWEERKISVSYCEQSAQLALIRAEMPEISRWACHAEQDVIRRLDLGFQSFFRRIKSGETPGYPRFRGRGWYDSATFDPLAGSKWNTSSVNTKRPGRSKNFKPTTTTVYLQGIGHVKVRQHREIKGEIKTITVKRQRNKWFVILSCDNVPQEILPKTGESAGIDLGINVCAMTDSGYSIENPRYAKISQDRVADLRRSLSSKKIGSNNRRKAKEKLNKATQKVTNQREDFQYKAALDLIKKYDTIYLEDLNVKQMLESDGKYGKKNKTGLNRSIQDAGWASFIKKIVDKAESAGREIIFVNPAYTSQTCPLCGHISRENRNGIKFKCVSCGHIAHADQVGAINIKRRGQGLTSLGNALVAKPIIYDEKSSSLRPEYIPQA
jgi:putative transposase